MAEQFPNSEQPLSAYFGELLHESAGTDDGSSAQLSSAPIVPEGVSPPLEGADPVAAGEVLVEACNARPSFDSLDDSLSTPSAPLLHTSKLNTSSVVDVPVVVPVVTTTGTTWPPAGPSANSRADGLAKLEPAPAVRPELLPRAVASSDASTAERKRRVEKLLLDSTLRLAPPAVEVDAVEADVVDVEVVDVGVVEIDVVDVDVVDTAVSEAQVFEPVKAAALEELPVTAPVAVPVALETEQAKVAERTELAQQWRNGRPDWAQEAFDVLLFTVSQLTLAVPLIALGKIQKINDELTPLFGQADWFMGVLPTDQGKIRCVDTALFVMPERYRPEFRDNYRFIITIDGFPWGLAVDEVKQPIQLQPEAVNWRGKRSQRPWLAGTIRERMCALIDIPKLGDLLIAEDKNSSTHS